MAEITVCEQTVVIPDAPPSPSPSPTPGGGGGVLLATANLDGTGTVATLDKTLGEIMSTLESGMVFVKVPGEDSTIYAPLASTQEYEIEEALYQILTFFNGDISATFFAANPTDYPTSESPINPQQ